VWRAIGSVRARPRGVSVDPANILGAVRRWYQDAWRAATSALLGERGRQLLVLGAILTVLVINLVTAKDGRPDGTTVALLVLLVAAASLPRLLELRGPLGVGLRLSEVRALEVRVHEDLRDLGTERVAALGDYVFRLSVDDPATGVAEVKTALLRRLVRIHRFLYSDQQMMVAGSAVVARLRQDELIPDETARLTYQVLALTDQVLAEETVTAGTATELARLANTAYKRLNPALLLDGLTRRTLGEKGFSIEKIPDQPTERLAFFRAAKGDRRVVVAARYIVNPYSAEFAATRSHLAEALDMADEPAKRAIAVVPDGLNAEAVNSEDPRVVVLRHRTVKERSAEELSG
jgi:hypothetical protein